MPEPYEPCPCGSGKKYKFCCRDKDRAAPAAGPKQLPDGSRLVTFGGREYAVRGHSDDDLAAASAAHEFFEAKRAGRGPAKQMMDFIQPLLDDCDGSKVAIQGCMDLGTFCWNLALSAAGPREVEDAIAAAANDLQFGNLRDHADFFLIARKMVDRHREMFPQLNPRAKGE